MQDRPVSLPAYFRLIRENRNFRLLWSAQIISELGDWFYSVAIYSMLLEYTGSAKSVALAFVLQVLPQFFFAPTAGVINDRMSRKRVMIFADWCRAIIVLGMLLVRTPQFVPFLYVLLFLETAMWALFEPGRNSVIPNITKGSDVVVANALSSTTWSFNLAVGSAVGGIVAAMFGRDTVFLINAVSFIASALLLARMSFSEPHLANLPALRAKDLADFTPILEGIRYVRKDRRLLVTMFAKCGLGAMGASWVILPILGERVFPVGGTELGSQRAGMLGMSLLMASRGVGALVGPLISGYWAGNSEPKLRLGIFYGFIAGGVGYMALGAAATLPAACLGLIVSHMGGSTIWVFSTTLLQKQTEDRFRGRVFSAEFAFSMLATSVVSYTAGVLIDRGSSPQTLATVTGVLVLVPAVAWAFALRMFGADEKTTPVSGSQ